MQYRLPSTQRRFAALLAVLAAGLLPCAAVAAAPRTFAVRLLAPAAGSTLRGGSAAVLRWDELGGTAIDAATVGSIDEWEAFLSLDGGRTFPLRVTPHLDIARREVRWLVPNLPTDDARLMLRVGNERREREILLPTRFSIVAGTAAPWERRSFAPGESARAGQSGVVSWSEGDRQGRGWREVHATALDAGAAGTRAPRLVDASHTQACDRQASPSLLRAPSSDTSSVLQPPRSARPAFDSPPPAGDILLLIQRRNE